MIGTGVLESTVFDTRAQVLAALGDPTRLRILHVLRRGTCCVCALRDRVEVAPNLLSYHLKVLRDAGVIEGTRRGRWIDYRVIPGVLEELGRALSGGIL